MKAFLVRISDEQQEQHLNNDKLARHVVGLAARPARARRNPHTTTAVIQRPGRSVVPEFDWALLLPGSALLALTASMLAVVIHPHF